VVLDAGHGGHDHGGIPQNLLREKDVAIDVVLRLNRELQKAGFKTILTRRDDTFIPLGTRVAIANAHPEAVFVSIHYDASPRRGACGISTHFSSPGEASLARFIQRRLMTTTDECGCLTYAHDAALAQRAAYRQKQAEQICAGIVEYRNSL
jgi:N-acetylmuramoyl-L-alanine amidase